MHSMIASAGAAGLSNLTESVLPTGRAVVLRRPAVELLRRAVELLRRAVAVPPEDAGGFGDSTDPP
jgi:hypothetical protein